MPDRTVLIVEDNPDDYLLLERAFKKAQLPVKFLWLRDGAEAEAYLAGEGQYSDRERYPLPVFALVDLKMPRRNGFELLSWIRGRPAVRRLPVVVLTSSNQSPDINKAYELGANSYLVKPGPFDRLLELSQALKQYWLTLNQNPDWPS